MQSIQSARPAGKSTRSVAATTLLDDLIEGNFIDRWARMFATGHQAPERHDEIRDHIIGMVATEPLPLNAQDADSAEQVQFVFHQARKSVETMLGTPMVTIASTLGELNRQERLVRRMLVDIRRPAVA